MPLPSRSRLRNLAFALDGVPFVQLAARDNINTLDLDYSLDGIPGVAAHTVDPPTSGWGETVYFRPWCTTGRSPS